jgi:hypothetical protein
LTLFGRFLAFGGGRELIEQFHESSLRGLGFRPRIASAQPLLDFVEPLDNAFGELWRLRKSVVGPNEQR